MTLGDALRSIERREQVVRALVDEPDRSARLERAIRDAPAGPLRGTLVGVKDVFHVDGLPTRAGSAVPPEALAGAEAGAVRRLRDAGAVVLAKTVTTEFAYFHPGPTTNPRDPARTPGGSSSGSAAAVAAGYAPFAIGTQTAGSVIRPAAFCGVVGYKATYGRIPIDGCIPLAPSLDTVGVLASDVAVATGAASVLCDGWRPGVRAEPCRVGVPEALLGLVDAGARKRFEATLRRLGWDAVRVPLFDDVAAMVERHGALMAAEAARVHARWFERYGERYASETAGLVRRGLAIDDGELAALRRSVLAVRDVVERASDAADVPLWVSPAATGIAPAGLASTGRPDLNLPWTAARVPVVTIPHGTVDGMPLGLQVAAARSGDDEALLAHAALIERSLAER